MISNSNINPISGKKDIVNAFIVYKLNSVPSSGSDWLKSGLFGHDNGNYDKFVAFSNPNTRELIVSGDSGDFIVIGSNSANHKQKTVKEKDPRKVELGKRLAKISKEAKERKARERQQEADKLKNEEINNHNYFGPSALQYLIGGVTLVAALRGLYFAYKKDKREIKEKEKIELVKHNDNKIFQSVQLRGEPSRCSIENL